MAYEANFCESFLPEFLSVFDIFAPFYTKAIITNRKPEISGQKTHDTFFITSYGRYDRDIIYIQPVTHLCFLLNYSF